MSIRVRIAHQTTGRVRLELPQQRGDRELVAHIAERLEASGLFDSVRANPVTASIVLQFTRPPGDILRQLEGQLGVPLEWIIPATPAPEDTNFPFRLVSGRDINPMLMAGTVFGAVGMVQTVRGKIMLPALSAFWYAMNAFRMAGMPRQENDG